ncbi:MAG: hypothetical protein ACTSPB_12175 [Candidatus Thorarchaeota archaeon]
MVARRIKVGDHVRIVNFLKHGNYPVGVVESIDGAYIYVHTPVADETEKDRCIFEMYENEIVYLTDKEYFKALLDGNNLDD